MKKLLLTVVLGLCTLAGFSQAKFDVHAGMSMANITNSDADLKIGYSVGVGMDYAITDMWAFQTGLNFTSSCFSLSLFSAKSCSASCMLPSARSA